MPDLAVSVGLVVVVDVDLDSGAANFVTVVELNSAVQEDVASVVAGLDFVAVCVVTAVAGSLSVVADLESAVVAAEDVAGSAVQGWKCNRTSHH